MQWSEVPTKLGQLYDAAALWVFEHPVETDLLIIGAVTFALVKLFESRRRKSRRKFRLMRGSWMSEEQRRRLQRMRFEDALGDAALDMLMSGEMSKEDEKFWNIMFHDAYKFTGMIPGPLSKAQKIRGALTRITFYKRRPWAVVGRNAGGPPVATSDPDYIPNSDKYSRLSNSRYAKPLTE